LKFIHLKLVYNQTDRYFMAKISQVTHRLVGFTQVFELAWKLVKEYLTINECFSGIISVEFISDIQSILSNKEQ